MSIRSVQHFRVGLDDNPLTSTATVTLMKRLYWRSILQRVEGRRITDVWYGVEDGYRWCSGTNRRATDLKGRLSSFAEPDGDRAWVPTGYSAVVG